MAARPTRMARATGSSSSPSPACSLWPPLRPLRRKPWPSTAGLGWHGSLGRLNPPCTAAGETGINGQPSTPMVYEGPDGAQHLFYTTLHNSDSITPNVFYTRDGSYLRLVTGLANGESEID